MASTFSHLSAHSHYSLLNGLPQVGDLVTKAAEYGCPALALTDKNNLYGAIEFYKTCNKKGIKPILGVDLDVFLRGTKTHLVLLAENKKGYDNLIKIVSKAHLENAGDIHALEKHIKGHTEKVLVLLPESALEDGGKTFVEGVRSLFQEDAVYARIGWNNGEDEMKKSIARAKEYGLTPVAGGGSYYLSPDDKHARDIVRRIADPSVSPDAVDRSFIDPRSAAEKFAAFPELIEENAALVSKVSLELSLGSWMFPAFPIKEGVTYEEELERFARESLKEKGLDGKQIYEDRLVYELSVINEKGFAPYFLAVSDLLTFAKRSGILSTTRGSAAGSLVSYVTGITTIDPILLKLPFERFLNPERPKAPDIDMDFADTRRDEMIQYARDRYGSEAVAQIGTFGTMMARAAVRDVARALGYSYGVGDRIAKAIPFGSQGFPMTIDKALETEEELRELYQSDEDAEIIINTAKQIEGNARHISVHAAGIVIAPGDATDYVPVQYDPHGRTIITQFDMHAVEDVGLLKFDFLGLKNLSILGDAVTRVKARTGKEIDIESVPLDDSKVFEMLGRGETEGVFQLGGSGMTRYLKELAPTSIDDINAMVALYRPGPMESIPEYIRRKRNPSLISYIDPRMEKILERSYGIITYQDDVLLIAIELAGYSWLEADNLRKAMGKKIPAEMEAQKEKFIAGCAEHGKLPPQKAQAIWKLIEPFAAYGFNKAHAASYGKVAYQTAYMKTHFPADYMASLLSADSGDTDRIAAHVAECVRLGIPVLPPDVNESFDSFTVSPQGDSIRFGLQSIKNFGEGAARAIIEERTKGPFVSLGDFAARISQGAVGKRAVEALIQSGALDRFGDRGALLKNLDAILALQSERRAAPKDQGSLFTLEYKAPDIEIHDTEVTPLHQKLLWEKELLGIYVSGHPTDQFKEVFEKYKGSLERAIREERNGFPMVVGGVIETAKTILTKKGEKMAFVTISDPEHALETVVFPKVYAEHKDNLVPGTCVLVKGKVSRRNGEPSLLVDAVKKLSL